MVASLTPSATAPPALVLPAPQPLNPPLLGPRAAVRDQLPCILTAHDLLTRRPSLGPALRSADFTVRVVDDWRSLLDQVDRQPFAAVLVDLDAAQPVPRQPLHVISGYRLVALLARYATRHARCALLVQTALDFAEIEDLVRQGVDLLIHPWLRDEELVAGIQRVVRRTTVKTERVATRQSVAPEAERTGTWLSTPPYLMLAPFAPSSPLP